MPIPPNRNIGDAGHVNDHNDIAAELTTISSDVTNLQNNMGLVLIDHHSFTSQTAVTRSDIFTSTYLNYQIIVTVTNGTANTEIVAQFTAAGTPATTNYHFIRVGASTGGTVQNFGAAAGASFPITFIPAIKYESTSYFIGMPAQAVYTTYRGDWLYDEGTPTGGAQIFGRVGGRHKTATAYDGIKISCASAFTGTITTYGYRD